MSKKMFLHSRLGVDDAFSIFKLWWPMWKNCLLNRMTHTRELGKA